MPCNNCSACIMNDCGECKFCLDKRKFGGPGKLKKRCELRTCLIPSTKKPGDNQQGKTKNGTNIVTTFTLKEPQARNKFLSSVDIDDGDINSSFDDSYCKSIDDSSPSSDQSASLQSFIYSGLVEGGNGETYEVVEVIQAEDKPCYICKTFTTEDLFYCSSCYAPFHQFCLQMQHLPHPKGVQSGSLCGRCLDSKDSYEQDMNNRAKAIDAKCEEINGKQYQVISFLTEPEQEKLNQDLNLDSVDPWALPVNTNFGLQTLNDLPGSYDMDFDKYLQTNGLAISLQE